MHIDKFTCVCWVVGSVFLLHITMTILKQKCIPFILSRYLSPSTMLYVNAILSVTIKPTLVFMSDFSQTLNLFADISRKYSTLTFNQTCPLEADPVQAVR
jgi:hypothetical protein